MANKRKKDDLEGKRVIITGGASGIGKGIVKKFLDAGSKVIVLDKNKKLLNELITKEKKLIAGLITDISDYECVKDSFKQAKKLMGGVDILISNAGISIRKKFLNITHSEWHKVIQTNLSGMFYCCQEAAKMMMKQKKGTILMTASVNGLVGYPYYANYNASKAGVISLAKSMALELAPYIRVVAVSPGAVWTPMQEREYTKKMKLETEQKIPLKRHANPEEIAELFAYLASEKAKFITGENIVTDGGELAGSLGSR